MVGRIIGSSRIPPEGRANRAIARLPGPVPGAPLRLVIDTNLWLDLLVFADPSAARLDALLANAAGARVLVLATGPMRAELAAVLARPRFALDAARQAQVLDAWDARVDASPIAPDCAVACTDPDDRMFLDLAIAQRAHWLLSRDRALLAARKPAAARFALRIGRLPDFYNWLDDGRSATASEPASEPASVRPPEPVSGPPSAHPSGHPAHA